MRGFFIGAYGPRSCISGRADGTVTGLGLIGGIYGSNRLQYNLYLVYYADIAGFTGAALSGEMEIGGQMISPRDGCDEQSVRNWHAVTSVAFGRLRSC